MLRNISAVLCMLGERIDVLEEVLFGAAALNRILRSFCFAIRINSAVPTATLVEPRGRWNSGSDEFRVLSRRSSRIDVLG
jgi:hypothetical protein